ncbi:hypothetical protein [Photobacterium leiognathi]|uniref:hypothetical protein n=1 Tax=Photobacterium leiognathi TaxID=553611 RepID=UPI0029821D13|nr:hypothetical protein [Photobacterium leiognathi]
MKLSNLSFTVLLSLCSLNANARTVYPFYSGTSDLQSTPPLIGDARQDYGENVGDLRDYNDVLALSSKSKAGSEDIHQLAVNRPSLTMVAGTINALEFKDETYKGIDKKDYYVQGYYESVYIPIRNRVSLPKTLVINVRSNETIGRGYQSFFDTNTQYLANMGKLFNDGIKVFVEVVSKRDDYNNQAKIKWGGVTERQIKDLHDFTNNVFDLTPTRNVQVDDHLAQTIQVTGDKLRSSTVSSRNDVHAPINEAITISTRERPFRPNIDRLGEFQQLNQTIPFAVKADFDIVNSPYDFTAHVFLGDIYMPLIQRRTGIYGLKKDEQKEANLSEKTSSYGLDKLQWIKVTFWTDPYDSSIRTYKDYKNGKLKNTIKECSDYDTLPSEKIHNKYDEEAFMFSSWSEEKKQKLKTMRSSRGDIIARPYPQDLKLRPVPCDKLRTERYPLAYKIIVQ